MEPQKQKMTLCLWYDDQAEAAVDFYLSIFKNGRKGRISRYGKEGFEIHHKPEGTAMTVEFELNGMNLIALNGGPQFKFNEACSLVVPCQNQQEIDHYWQTLTEGGEEGPCGWLKDKYGLSWQIVPAVLPRMLADADAKKAQSVTKAFLQMKKFDLATLQRAYEHA